MKRTSTLFKALLILCFMAALGGCNKDAGGSGNKAHGHSHD
jgi:predicted small secreted protein